MATLTSEQKQKAAETRRNNRLAAERRQRNRRTLWTVLGIIALVLFGYLIWRTIQSYTPVVQTAESTLIATSETLPTKAPTNTPTAAPTEAPVVQPTAAPTAAPTEAPVVQPTAAPVLTNAVPATPIVACETIEISKDNGVTWVNGGLPLETESVYDIGKRVTFTSRSILVPTKAYNKELSPAELKLVETTWLDVKFNACDTEAVVFSHGFEMNNTTFNGGVLFSFKGEQQIRIRNGEIALWYDTQHRDKDLGRIVEQIKIGNFDIHGPLAFSVADRLKDVKVLADYLATRSDVKIVILP